VAIVPDTTNKTLTFNLPPFYDSNGNRTNPTVTSDGNIQYSGVGPVSVSYSEIGTNLVRSVNVAGTVTSRVIATNVNQFTPGTTGEGQPCSITFTPKFTRGSSTPATLFCNTFLRTPNARNGGASDPTPTPTP